MGNRGRGRALGAVALAVLGGALLSVVVFVAVDRLAQRTEAAFPEKGLDLSISVGTECDSTAGPTSCNFSPGETFTLMMKVNTIPAEFGYEGYGAQIDFSAVTYVTDSLTQTGPGTWPDCAFPASSISPGKVLIACAVGAVALPSTYTGALFLADFKCPDGDAFGTMTLLHGIGNTELVVIGANFGETGSESLSIFCGSPPTPTATPTLSPTPCPTGGCPTATETSTPTLGASATPTFTPTATRTITPTPTSTVTPTRTRRPHETLLGDVDGDLTIGARDALWVLWFDARIVVDVPIPEAADLNADDLVDATDALLILWVDGGLFEPL